MLRSELIEEGRSMAWFHAIDFGDWVSPGRFSPDSTPNGTLLPVYEFMRHLDLKGTSVLDIGSADGIVAFAAEALGATRVVATDGNSRRQFQIARELLGSDVEYVPGVKDIELGARSAELGSFDVVVIAGFLYHLFSPLAAIAAARKLVRPGGLLILETVYLGGDEPFMMLNTALEPPLVEQVSTFWIGTRSSLAGMLRLCCFDPIASATVGALHDHADKRGRLGLVARAVSPEEVHGGTPQLQRTHTGINGTAEMSFVAARADHGAEPFVYSGPGEHTEVRSDAPSDWIPFQPSSERVKEFRDT